MPLLVGSNPLAPEGFATEVSTTAQVGDSGITFGATDDQGVRWAWTAKNTWGGKPAPRERVGDREYDHGQWDATKFYGPRQIAIPGWVKAPDHGTLHYAEQRLRDAVTLTPFYFRVAEPGFESFALVRQQGEIQWSELNHKTATFSIGLYSPDPLIYSERERTFDLSFPTTSGGLVWPATWPATWSGVQVTGSVALTNPGTWAAPLNLLIYGPATTVQIKFPETGQVLHLENPEGPLLTDGQWLSVDTGNREVLLNGDAGRRSWAFGDWPILPPGAVTTLSIDGTGTASYSSVSGSYRAARI